MNRCIRCVMPDTRPGIIFNEQGVCQACENFDKRSEKQWDQREIMLSRILQEAKRKAAGYDCVVAVSGGKDSHVLVHEVTRRGLRPLLVNVADPFTKTAAGAHNLANLTKTFGCDLVQYHMNTPLVVTAARHDFETLGEPLRFIETMIYTIPTHFAISLKIPLVVYGEDSAYEYGSSAVEVPAIDVVCDAFDRMETRSYGRLLPPLRYPIAYDSPRAIFWSHYVPWDGEKNMQVAKQFGFHTPEHEWRRLGHHEHYDQIDSMGYLIHLWLKFPKFGFARQADICARWIRAGKMTRQEALSDLVERDSMPDPRALEDFCQVLGYSEREFWEITDRWYNRDIFEKEGTLWRMRKP